ncbi:YegS/Rv2252/BmrU family lipid kinase [Niallia taxi]|uniref:YegS/Rv2252/BmrU family lipid kinase n=1 Tax=Niallia taxi TaxID=2499688 RepID=UPI003D2C94F2
MKYKNALFIYNGNAGKKEIDVQLQSCLHVFAKEIDHLQVFKTKGPNHAAEICGKYGEQTELVIVLGGDGTIHECVNGLAGLQKRPVLAILPGGTCNDFSRTLNIQQNLQRAAKELVLYGVEEPVDIIQTDSAFFLNFWGIGLVAETSNNIREEEKNILGRASYLLSAIRTIQNTEPKELVMNIDGKEIREKAVLAMVVNGKYIGGKLLPFSAISYNDGLVDVFIVKNTNLHLLKELNDLRKIDFETDEELKEEVMYMSGKHIKISSEHFVDVDMDGEVYTKTPSELKVLPSHLKMLRPDF